MQQQRICKVLAVISFFFWITPPVVAQVYDVDSENLEWTVYDINQNYMEALEMGIGRDSVSRFLERLLPQGQVSLFCPMPDAGIDEVTQSNILFSWPKVSLAVEYTMSCLNFSTGESGSMQIQGTQIETDRVNDAVCLYAFYSWCSPIEQSILRIIIVDKDIVVNGGEFDGNIPRLLNTEMLEENNIQLGPNPFDTELYLNLSLNKKASVKLHLLHGYTGIEQGVLLLNTSVAAGHHKLQIALPDLAPGCYYALLESNGRRIVIPLIKGSGRLP